MGQNAKYAYVAMVNAVEHSGLKPEEYESNPRVGGILGQADTSAENIDEVVKAVEGGKSVRAKIGPYRVTRTMSSSVSAVLSTLFKIQGTSYSIGSACATSAHCIGTAMEQIQLGKQDLVFAGAGECGGWRSAWMFDAMGVRDTHARHTIQHTPHTTHTSCIAYPARVPPPSPPTQTLAPSPPPAPCRALTPPDPSSLPLRCSPSPQALSTVNNDNPKKASRAFDENRDGFVFGAGGGIMVLESLEHAQARGAKIYGELTGYAATSDGYDMVAPSGEGGERAMTMAMEMADKIAGKKPIDYINTHGTSTPVSIRRLTPCHLVPSHPRASRATAICSARSP